MRKIRSSWGAWETGLGDSRREMAQKGEAEPNNRLWPHHFTTWLRVRSNTEDTKASPELMPSKISLGRMAGCRQEASTAGEKPVFHSWLSMDGCVKPDKLLALFSVTGSWPTISNFLDYCCDGGEHPSCCTLSPIDRAWDKEAFRESVVEGLDESKYFLIPTKSPPYAFAKENNFNHSL